MCRIPQWPFYSIKKAKEKTTRIIKKKENFKELTAPKSGAVS